MSEKSEEETKQIIGAQINELFEKLQLNGVSPDAIQIFCSFYDKEFDQTGSAYYGKGNYFTRKGLVNTWAARVNAEDADPLKDVIFSSFFESDEEDNENS